MQINILKWDDLDEAGRKQALSRPAQNTHDSVRAAVAEILHAVKSDKDKALREFAVKFDKCDPSLDLKLSEEEIAAAERNIDPELKQAIQDAYNNIKKFHEAQQPVHAELETVKGIKCRTATHAIDAVGLYVPGGSAPLVSTALMLGVPAKVAGCKKVILTSPHPLSDAIICAASLCGIKDIFRVGGAHAVAAMAYGTESVPKVNKIFGPGNQYVTAAKAMVADDPEGAAIDMPAGPSEVLIIADESADPDFVAADLLSQAEHGPDSQVILLSDSEALLEKVIPALEQQLEVLPRKAIAEKALSGSRFILCRDTDSCIEVSNAYAPEHLIVQIRDPESIADRLHNAGSIFLGSYTCESMGDYASGTNHTLPTYGHAAAFSALGTDDFRRRYTVSYASAEGLKNIGATVERLADAEGLFAHRNAVSIRLKKLS